MSAGCKLAWLLLVFTATVVRAQTSEPERVRPASGTFAELREASSQTAATVGEYLDEGHDWLYRRLEHWLEQIDLHYGGTEQEPIIVPLSPMRIGFESAFLHRSTGWELVATPSFDATLRLPNIERRARLFISTSDVQETPTVPALEHPPVRAGLRLTALPQVELELGVRAAISPSAFAALRWNPEFHAGDLKVYPFLKPYVETGVGFGVSGGLTLEHWDGSWIVRSSSYANWEYNSAATNWNQTFVVGHAQAIIQERNYGTVATGHDLACGTALVLNGGGDSTSHANFYEAGVAIKRPLHGGWLFFYVQPLVRWERQYDWHPDVGVRISFDALLWGLASNQAEVALKNWCH